VRRELDRVKPYRHRKTGSESGPAQGRITPANRSTVVPANRGTVVPANRSTVVPARTFFDSPERSAAALHQKILQ